MIKIIAGKYKGRIIATKPAANYRPSTGKFREALFSVLSSGKYVDRDFLHNAEVIDLFAGTGALAFEALSRGAIAACLVDQEKQYLLEAQEFAARIGVTSQITTICQDVLALSATQKQYNLVFMDPPYAQNYVTETLQQLIDKNYLTNGAIIAIDMSQQATYQLAKPYKLLLQKNYGVSKLVILQYQP